MMLIPATRLFRGLTLALAMPVTLALSAAAGPITIPIEKVNDRLVIRAPADPPASDTGNEVKVPLDAAIGSTAVHKNFYVATVSSDSYINRAAYDPTVSTSAVGPGAAWVLGESVHGTTYTDTIAFGALSLDAVAFGYPDEDSEPVVEDADGTLAFGAPKGATLGDGILIIIAANKLLADNVYVFSPDAGDTTATTPPPPTVRQTTQPADPATTPASFKITLGHVPDDVLAGSFDLVSDDTQFTVDGNLGDSQFHAAFDINIEYIQLPTKDAETVLGALGLTPKVTEAGETVAETDENGVDIQLDFGDNKAITITAPNSVVADTTSSTGYVSVISGVDTQDANPNWILGAPFFRTSHVILHYDEDGTAKVSLSPVVPTATTQTK